MNENAENTMKLSSAMLNKPISDEATRRLDALRDESIDYSDIPELDDEWFSTAERQIAIPVKKNISIRVDEDVLEFFKRDGKRYQTRINAVLRSYVEAHRA